MMSKSFKFYLFSILFIMIGVTSSYGQNSKKTGTGAQVFQEDPSAFNDVRVGDRVIIDDDIYKVTFVGDKNSEGDRTEEIESPKKKIALCVKKTGFSGAFYNMFTKDRVINVEEYDKMTNGQTESRIGTQVTNIQNNKNITLSEKQRVIYDHYSRFGKIKYLFSNGKAYIRKNIERVNSLTPKLENSDKKRTKAEKKARK